MRVGTLLCGTAAAMGLMAMWAAPASADWIRVAQLNVSDRAETDTISLPGGRLYDRIRLCVRRNPVHFIDADVHFRNGGHQDVSLASRINAGDCTRDIDLDGGQRDIERIVLRYEETSVDRARATVRVFAE